MATLISGIYSRAFCDGSQRQGWLGTYEARNSDSSTRTAWAGRNTLSVLGLPNGNYVTELRLGLPRPGKNFSIDLEIGPEGQISSTATLAYKFLSDENSSYNNAGSGTAKDGTFYFDLPGSTHTLQYSGELTGSNGYLYIWHGTADSSGHSLTALDRGTFSGTYDSAVRLEPLQTGQQGGDQYIWAYTGETLPDTAVPSYKRSVTFYPNYGANTPTTETVTQKFTGYICPDDNKQYYDANGKGLVTLPGTQDRYLIAQFELATIQLPAATRPGYSFAGWYTASTGGNYVGTAGDEFTLSHPTNTLYAHWTELTYSWNFNPVTAKGNSADSVVRGIWSGFVGGREVLCAACNGYLWELERREGGEWGKTACGAIDTSSDVHMFGFGGNMYLLNGSEYKVWDGESLTDVAGYRPMVAVSVPPAGGGTALEQINKLCPQRRARFSPDGTEKVFVLPEKGLASVDYVRSAATGADLTGWTADTANGKVSFTTAPAEGTNSIEIGWSVAGDTASEIRAMRYAELFNGAQDSRIFVYGDGTNRCFYTGIDYDGVPRADYFPELAVAHVGDSNTPLTAMIRHYDRLLAFKLDSAWSISYSAITLADGSVTAGFCVTPVNRSIGNCAPGQAVLVENRPRTLDGRSVVEWKPTSSGNINGDERNAERISQRVDDTIRSFDLTTAKTFYDKYAHEYYVIGADGTALVHGIEADAWYVYTNFAATCLINYKDELYFGTADGQLRHFSDEHPADNAEAIDAYWESGSMPFDQDFKRKYSAMLWVGIKPEDNGYLAVTAETDRKADFAEYSFTTGDAAGVPEMNRIKLKAKKFTYYKLKLSNNTADTTATVVSVDIRVRGTGYVR